MALVASRIDARDCARGALAGLAAGIVGTIAMDLISRLWTIGRRGAANHQEASLFHQGGRPDVEAAKKEGRSSGERGAVATTEIADRVAEPLLDRSLSPGERHQAGKVVHYSYGALAGALYGASVQCAPIFSSYQGVPFGLALWGIGVEWALPKLRVAAPPHHYSAGEHAFSVVTHTIYGLVAELTRRRLRTLF